MGHKKHLKMGNQLISLKNVPFYQGEYVLPVYLPIYYLSTYLCV